VRPFGLFLAVLTLMLVGTAVAAPSADRGLSAAVEASAPHTRAAKETEAAKKAEAARIVVVRAQYPEPAGHSHDEPHQHDQDSWNGCCPLCCALAVPHVVVQDSEIVFERPEARVFFFAPADVIVNAAASLPFRPPRIG
jgi:hypothetical protein